MTALGRNKMHRTATGASTGIGPTEDDITREAIAHMLGEKPTIDPEQLTIINRFFDERKTPMPANNVKQAWLIPSAQGLPNLVGTAPGWYISRQGKILVCMPGVPREMIYMWSAEVKPLLLSTLPRESIVSRTLKTIGLEESAVEESIGSLTQSHNPTVATYAKRDGIYVRITAKAPTDNMCEKLIASIEHEIAHRLGETIYGIDNQTLSQSIVESANKHALTFATAEVGIEARLAMLFGSDFQTLPCYRGGLALKRANLESVLGLPSSSANELSMHLATHIRRILSSDIGLVVLSTLEKAAPDTDRYKGSIILAIDICGNISTRHITNTSTIEGLNHYAFLVGAHFLREVLREYSSANIP